MKNSPKKSVNASLQIRKESSYSGPIPDPESLAKYEQISPGFAERIMTMAEEESHHRRRNENRLVKSSVTMAILGIIFAFLSVIMFCGLILFALMNALNIATLGLAIGAIASVAGIFIVFRSRRKD